MRQILERLREAFPRALFQVQLDGGFASPEVFDVLDEQLDVDYVVAMSSNSVLQRRARRLLAKARRWSRKTHIARRLYGEFRYAAQKWSTKRQVIYY